MAEIILEKNGVPYVVFNPNEVNGLLQKGFRYPQKTPSVTNSNSTDLIAINTATQTALKSNLGLTTMQAKQVVNGRPYETIDQLIALEIEGISWEQFEPKLDFSV